MSYHLIIIDYKKLKKLARKQLWTNVLSASDSKTACINLISTIKFLINKAKLKIKCRRDNKQFLVTLNKLSTNC